MGLSEMLEKSSPIQVKRKKENASAFKSLANRNTELVDENKELKEEIERLNNIIKRLETDLYNMYINFGEFSEEYTEKCIKELKGESDEKN